jgi:hypothetical protein
MKVHQENGWFHASEFLRAADAVYRASPVAFMDADKWDCKYIQLYVDQRTKSFIFRNGAGEMVSHEDVYKMFPILRDDVELS